VGKRPQPIGFKLYPVAGGKNRVLTAKLPVLAQCKDPISCEVEIVDTFRIKGKRILWVLWGKSIPVEFPAGQLHSSHGG
jgi:hypothetical protein